MPSGILQDQQYTAGTTYKIAIATSVVSLGTDHATKIKPTSGDFANKSATMIWVHCVTSGIYFTPGGTDPDTSGNVGHPLEVGAMLEVRGYANIKNLKFIRQGSVSGAIMITPFFNMA